LVESEAEEQFLEDALGLRLGLLCEHDGVGIGGPACKTRLELESQYLTLDEGDRFHLQCLEELNVGTQKDLLLQDTDNFEPQVEVVGPSSLFFVFLEDFEDVLADNEDEINHLTRVVMVALEGHALLIHHIQSKSDLVKWNRLLILKQDRDVLQQKKYVHHHEVFVA